MAEKTQKPKAVAVKPMMVRAKYHGPAATLVLQGNAGATWQLEAGGATVDVPEDLYKSACADPTISITNEGE